MVSLLTNEEKINNMARTTIAPAKAPARVLMYPDSAESKAASRTPPPSNIIIATPRLAPVDTPRIEGSARGLLNTVCNSNPHTASAAPPKMAVMIVGIRDSMMIISIIGLDAPLPDRIDIISLMGISTDPMSRLPTERITKKAISIRVTEIVRVLFVPVLFIG